MQEQKKQLNLRCPMLKRRKCRFGRPGDHYQFGHSEMNYSMVCYYILLEVCPALLGAFKKGVFRKRGRSSLRLLGPTAGFYYSSKMFD